MKQWTVYFRDKNGSKASVVIEAEDRSGVFAELKKRGISAISVSEGASNKKPRKVASSGAASKGRGLIAAAIVVLGLGAAVWFLMPMGETLPVDDTQKRVPNKPKRSEIRETHGVNKSQKMKEEKTKLKHSKIFGGKEVYLFKVVTNGTTIATTYKDAEGVEHLVYSSTEKPIFDNASDQVLAMALERVSGEDAPPMPITSSADADFKASLKKKIVINENDSELIKAYKESVMEARQKMLEMLKSGRTVKDVLEEHERMMNEDAKMRSDIAKELRSIIEEGDIEEAEKYYKGMNDALVKLGIKELEMPEELEKE